MQYLYVVFYQAMSRHIPRVYNNIITETLGSLVQWQLAGELRSVPAGRARSGLGRRCCHPAAPAAQRDSQRSPELAYVTLINYIAPRHSALGNCGLY